LATEAWAAIELHADRVGRALAAQDAPLTIGSAKELIESVARVVLDAKGIILPSNADFDSVINRAHVAMERQPGQDVSMSPEVRTIASSAKKIVIGVRDI